MTDITTLATKLGLDLDLNHVVLISGRPYITRDGYLHIAHASQVLDGIEVLSEHETETHWVAKVAVHRKDMSHPFTYAGRYPKNGQQRRYGPEMAVKTSEVAALRRAFDVTGAGAADEMWDEPHTEVADPWPERDADLAALSDLASALDKRTWGRLKKQHDGWHVDRGVYDQLVSAVIAAAQDVAAEAGDDPMGDAGDGTATGPAATTLVEVDA